MAIVKKLRNATLTTMQILNRDIDPGESYTVPSHLWFELIDSTDVQDKVTNGDIIVNDGTIDLNVIDGLDLISTFQLNTSTFDENTILVDDNGSVLTDHNGNVLIR